jgi:hypothetical protein
MSLVLEQLTFDQLMARFRPLLEMQEAAWCLNVPRIAVDRLIDSGNLPAFDLGLGKHARMLRVCRYAVIHILAGRTEPIQKIPIEDLLPHSRADFLVRELMGLFACTDQHIYNLAARDKIKAPRISQSSQRRVPRFTRESVIAFLKEREIQ